MLAHKLWLKHQDADKLQVLSSSSWIPHVLLPGSATVAAVPAIQQQSAQVVYDYAQSLEEVLVEAQLPAHIQQGDIHVKLTPSTLLVVVGRQRLVDGRLAGLVDPEHSSWKIEGQGKSRKLSVTLCKQPAASGQRFAIWSSLLQQVDAQKSPEKRDQLLTKRVE